MAHTYIEKYIASIWVSETTNAAETDTRPTISYPGITPELFIPLRGHLDYWYRGKQYSTTQSTLFAFLHENIYTDLSSLKKFVIVSFRSRALASLLPFISIRPIELIRQPIVPARQIFGESSNELQKGLVDKNEKQIIAEVLDFLQDRFTDISGFITEVADEVGPDFSLQTIRQCTNYSYSTIERRFKEETGISPKKYLTLKRFKSVVASIIETNNTDWMDYVVRFGYHDQSHFIKEIRKYAGVSPSQLINQKNLLMLRPDLSFLTKFYNEKM
ncbi:MAG: AraC family transcriptional regulator [Saprospiraceae bacterium]|nr:helix-turn-helix transcriptional regulator [Lewinella sp.]